MLYWNVEQVDEFLLIGDILNAGRGVCEAMSLVTKMALNRLKVMILVLIAKGACLLHHVMMIRRLCHRCSKGPKRCMTWVHG